ncbi:PQQ-dependent sugar dehydrogenase [Microlunatus panaciterrae]|nr:PQQ-dependent sugar dehydrogenase [Microlunatus panaciterrae]
MIGVALVAGCSGPASQPAAGTRTAGATPSASSPAAPTSAPQTRAASPTRISTAATAGSSATEAAGRHGPLRARDVVTGLTSPWGLAFLSDGTALVAERDTGRILRVAPTGRTTQVQRITDSRPSSEGGLLGLAVAPDQKTVFAYYSARRDNRVVAMSWDGAALGRSRAVIDGIPESGRHNGGQLTFGPDGYLYVATGDATEPAQSQDKKSLAGKILRITPQGRPAPGNPFGNEVFSLGHRNVQGLAFDPQGRLWASEFGDQTWDELNLIIKGGNYGWPAAEGSAQLDGMINPKVVWRTDDASPSGLAYWRGSLWMAGLRGKRLWQIPLDGTRTGEPKSHFAGRYGRLRAVKALPNGSGLWLGTSNTDGRGQPKPGDDRLLSVTG